MGANGVIVSGFKVAFSRHRSLLLWHSVGSPWT